jgi:hypothetical protein
MEWGELEVGVEVEEARGEGEAGEFEHLFPG